MTGKKDEYTNEQKTKCINYCLKRGINKSKAQQIAAEFEKTGLEFPEELLLYNKLLK